MLLLLKIMKNIRLLSLAALQECFVDQGFKKSQANRLYRFLWQQYGRDFDLVDGFPGNLLEWLKTAFYIPQTSIHTFQQSADKTIKCSVRLQGGHLVESVLIPSPRRMTVCVSSQVGCSLSCKFCATGYMERMRNLGFDEIWDQVVLLNQLSHKEFGRPVTNVVFMGMGEPLLNYSHVLRAVHQLTDQRGLSIAPRRITISTAGVSKMISKLAEEGVKVNLALSLHAGNDQKRNEIMPINESNNLDELKQALNYFAQCTRNEITLEYILLKDFNDGLADADELIAFARAVPFHLVNLIEFNPIDNAAFQRPEEHTMNAFVKHLQDHGINAHLRRSRGKDIDAACGQLAGRQALDGGISAVR